MGQLQLRGNRMDTRDGSVPFSAGVQPVFLGEAHGQTFPSELPQCFTAVLHTLEELVWEVMVKFPYGLSSRKSFVSRYFLVCRGSSFAYLYGRRVYSEFLGFFWCAAVVSSPTFVKGGFTASALRCTSKVTFQSESGGSAGRNYCDALQWDICNLLA